MTLQDIIRTLAPLGSLKLLATGSLKNRASALDNVRHVLRGKFLYLVSNQSLIAPHDAIHLEPGINSGLVTARIAAFIPGASPPEVRIPIALCFVITYMFLR